MIKADNVYISSVLPGKSEHQEKLDAALKVCITFKMEKIFTSFRSWFCGKILQQALEKCLGTNNYCFFFVCLFFIV